MTKMKAINDTVIVEVEIRDAVSAGGIILGKQEGSLRKGTVLDIGPKAVDEGVVVGDVVAFHVGHGQVVEGLEQYMVVPVKSLLYALND